MRESSSRFATVIDRSLMSIWESEQRQLGVGDTQVNIPLLMLARPQHRAHSVIAVLSL